MDNTIRLLHGEWRLTKYESKKFKKGDTIWGDGASPDELKKWPISEKKKALEELEKRACSYIQDGQLLSVDEYALEYYEEDEDGEFVTGSDYDLAKEKRDFD